MTVEITSFSINSGIVTISGIDCSEENLQRIMRNRDDGAEQEVEFLFDTTQYKDLKNLVYWMHRQKATNGCHTWGEALNALRGTVTDISSKYRNWE